jgi:beta-glucosidase
MTAPLAGIQARVENAQVTHFATEADLDTLGDFDVAVVVTGLTYREEGEFIPTAQQESEQQELARGGDRLDLLLPERERDLIRRVTQVANKTVVVLEGGSAIEVRDWLDSVDSLVMAWYPGREGGHAIARVLFGDVNPSGRLPVSFPRSIKQLMDWDVTALDVEHTLLHGYRYLDFHGEKPEFPFGFGLSYTTFTLSALTSERQADGFRLLVDVTNNGERSGATVVQIYVATHNSEVFRAPRELKHFARVYLEAGATARVLFEIADDNLRYYDADADGWCLESCDYEFLAGFSAAELPLSETWGISEGAWRGSA